MGQAARLSVTIPPELGEAVRDDRKQAKLARTPKGVEVVALDGEHGRRVGELLRDSATGDVVDAHVAVLTQPGGEVVTSDPREIATLLASRGVEATVVEV